MTITPDDKNGPNYSTLTFDGSQLYAFQDIETLVSEMNAKAKAAGNPVLPATEQNLGIGFVVNSEVPHDISINGAGQVWLTYASASYFQNISTNVLEIPWVFGARRLPIMANEQITRHATWTMQTNSPYLPMNISYLSASADFTNGQYWVNAYTNFENMKLPLRSTFEVYLRGDVTKSINVYYRFTVEGTAFGDLTNGFVFPPNVPVLTGVTDHRFNDPTYPNPYTPVSYVINTRFLTKEEAKSTPYFDVAKLHKYSAQTQIRGAGGRFTILLIMSGISLLFLILFIRSSSSTKPTK